jgi:hypothetical protein
MEMIDSDLLRAVASPDGGEVRRQLWFALRVLVRQPSPGGLTNPSALAALDALEEQPGDERAAAALGGLLAELAEGDEAFAESLRRWLAEAAGGDAPNVVFHNVVNGGIFHGPVLQGGDMSDILSGPRDGRSPDGPPERG